jgi:hypothetical protein
LVQLEDELSSRSSPEIAIVAYAGFHDERNVFSRRRRKFVAEASWIHDLQMPVATIDDAGSLSVHYDTVDYRPWPLMRSSSIVHLAERTYNAWLVKRRADHDQEVTKSILRRIAEDCDRYQVRLVVAGIAPGAETGSILAWCRETGIEAVDISVDRNDPANTNLPFDAHPSPHAHRQFAEVLHRYLTSSEPDEVPTGKVLLSTALPKKAVEAPGDPPLLLHE